MLTTINHNVPNCLCDVLLTFFNFLVEKMQTWMDGWMDALNLTLNYPEGTRIHVRGIHAEIWAYFL